MHAPAGSVDAAGESEVGALVGAGLDVAMLDVPIQVSSHDPISGAEIRVDLDSEQGARWDPENAVVLAAPACRDEASFRSCCDVLNFFETAETAQRFLREHPEVSGAPISIPVAVDAARTIFADVLTDDGEGP